MVSLLDSYEDLQEYCRFLELRLYKLKKNYLFLQRVFDAFRKKSRPE